MARKGENIYKRKDGRWEGRYIKSRSSTGKANYGYVYAKSYREVKAKLISQSSCTSNSVTVDPEISSDQFEQVAMEWFQAICPKVKESEIWTFSQVKPRISPIRREQAKERFIAT